MLSGFDRRKGISNPFLESGNEPSNPSAVSFSVPISFKRRYIRRCKRPSFGFVPRLSRGIHGPLAWISLFSRAPSMRESIVYRPRRKKVARIHIQIVTSRMYPLHARRDASSSSSTVFAGSPRLQRRGSSVKALPSERRTFPRINGQRERLITNSRTARFPADEAPSSVFGFRFA